MTGHGDVRVSVKAMKEGAARTLASSEQAHVAEVQFRLAGTGGWLPHRRERRSHQGDGSDERRSEDDRSATRSACTGVVIRSPK